MEQFVVGLGEALWDVLPGERKLGGAPVNFAYHVSQFGFKALAVSAVGKDLLGDETLRSFDVKHLAYIMPRVDYPTGTVQVSVDAAGIPSYEIKQRVAWDHIPFTEEMENVAHHCRAVCFGSLAQRSEESRNAILNFLDSVPKNCLKIFDINIRQNFYSKEVIEESFNRCDILKINDEEIIVVAKMLGYDGLGMEEVCCQLQKKYSIDIVVLTCGVNGSYVFSSGKKSFMDTPKVKVIDTVGAGDSFTGSFCAAILKGKSIEEAHALAVKVSAFVCTKSGAMPDMTECLE